VRYSHIPNFVYRWTENEVIKTVNTFLPAHTHEFHFHYGMSIPTDRLAMSPSAVKRAIGRLATALVPIFDKFLPKQTNNFGFAVVKNRQLQDWLIADASGQMAFSEEYARRHFNVDACNWVRKS
jgi:hypothetical protein